MNRQRLLGFNIQGILVVSFLIAIFLPMIFLARLTLLSATDLTIQNLEAYIEESGSRRQEAIENDFRTALNIVNTFLDSQSNRRALVNPLTVRFDQGTSAESRRLEDRVEFLFTNEIIDTGLFNSAWLLTPGEMGDAFATASAPDRSIPFNRLLQNESRSQIAQVGQALITSGGEDTQALVVTERTVEGEGTSQHVEIINLLYDDSGELPRFVGYAVFELNLERIIIENLTSERGQFDSYAYVILPRTNEPVAAEDVLPLVDLNSLGAQRILAREASNVDNYVVGSEDEQREVLGFYAPITIEDERFSLVTEIETSVVQTQLFSYVGAISFPVLIGSFILLFLLVLLLNQLLVPPLNQMREAVRGIIRGNFEIDIPAAGRGDEVGLLAAALVDMREQVRDLTDDMERRLRIRTRDVRVTQDITRTVTAERDLNKLMTQVVNLIVANFPSIYHAQIFLVDEDGQFAVLRASTGEAGRALLSRGHRLAVGSVSVIGQVTEQGQVIIARDTAESDVHRRNEFLQSTRAELAIPLRLGDQIIGALDVQSEQRDSFDEDQVTALQSLADQVTIAIQNARLYDESQRLLAELESDRRARTQRSWNEYIASQRENAITTRTGTNTGYKFETLRDAVYRSKQSVVGDVTPRQTVPFAVPIILRDEILGVVEYEIPEVDFSYEQVLLAEELMNRLAISLDNARLFQDSQRAAERERIVNDISTKITGQTNVEDIFETAIREISAALRTPRVAVRLHGNATENGHQNGASENGNAANPTDENPETTNPS